MRLSQTIELYVSDQWLEGRFNSPRTEAGYRYTLNYHKQLVGNRDPRTIGRDDIKRTLARWSHSNTRSMHRSHLVAFYDYLVEEGLRPDNPARQTRRIKGRPKRVYRLTRDEARSMRSAARGFREQAAIDLGLLVGLRAAELCLLQGRHFRRPGWVWVSPDIAKGRHERWVPVLAEFEPTWQRIARTRANEEYVICHIQQTFIAGQSATLEQPDTVCSYNALLGLVVRVGARAGIAARITPHLLRHAFGDHVSKFAGMKVAQFVLGHADIRTTQRYTDQPSLDEVAQALEGFGYGAASLPRPDRPSRPVLVPHRGLNAESPMRGLRAVLERLWASPVLREAARGMGS